MSTAAPLAVTILAALLVLGSSAYVALAFLVVRSQRRGKTRP